VSETVKKAAASPLHGRVFVASHQSLSMMIAHKKTCYFAFWAQIVNAAARSSGHKLLSSVEGHD